MAVGGLLLAAGAGRRLRDAQGAGRGAGRRGADGAARAAHAARRRLRPGRGRARRGGAAARRRCPAALVVVNKEWRDRHGLVPAGRLGGAARRRWTLWWCCWWTHPGITAEAVRRVGAGANPDTLRVATYGGDGGHPVLLGREHWAGAAALAEGDVGARAYLARHDGGDGALRRRLRRRGPGRAPCVTCSTSCSAGWRRRRAGRRWRPWCGTWQSAPRAAGRGHAGRPGRRGRRQRLRRLRRGRGLRAGQRGRRRPARPGAAALRRQRRRRVRGRPDLRRHHRGVRRAGRPRDVPGARRGRGAVRAGEPGRRGDLRRRPAGPRRRGTGGLAGPARRLARLGPARRRGHRRRPRACSPPGAPARCTTAPTASAAATS